MKLLRYGEIGREKPGILDANGRIRDLSRVIDDVAGDALGPDGLSRIKALDLGALPLVEGSPRIGAPVGVVPKFLGIGLNYRDHAEETGMMSFAVATKSRSTKEAPSLMPSARRKVLAMAALISRRSNQLFAGRRKGWYSTLLTSFI